MVAGSARREGSEGPNRQVKKEDEAVSGCRYRVGIATVSRRGGCGGRAGLRGRAGVGGIWASSSGLTEGSVRREINGSGPRMTGMGTETGWCGWLLTRGQGWLGADIALHQKVPRDRRAGDWRCNGRGGYFMSANSSKYRHVAQPLKSPGRGTARRSRGTFGAFRAAGSYVHSRSKPRP